MIEDGSCRTMSCSIYPPSFILFFLVVSGKGQKPSCGLAFGESSRATKNPAGRDGWGFYGNANGLMR